MLDRSSAQGLRKSRCSQPCGFEGKFGFNGSKLEPTPFLDRNPEWSKDSRHDGSHRPCALSTCQELRHVLILSGVVSPPFRGRIPAMIAYGHIDAVVDQELCRFIVHADGALMQNAGRLVRAPVRIYVGSVFQ